MASSIISNITQTFSNLWFRDLNEEITYINETAVRMRAGMLLVVPLFMSLTLYEAIYTSNWLPIVNTAIDTYETDWDGNTIYTIDAIKRTYDYSLQTSVLIFAFFDLLAGLFIFTSRFSPTILISSFLAQSQPPVWKPLVPKRYAWSIGASFISVCIAFFNPEILAGWVNSIYGSPLLPTTENYIPSWVPFTLVFVCLGFMWLEAILGFCVGCKCHSFLVKLGIHDEACDACNNIDWDEIAERNAQK